MAALKGSGAPRKWSPEVEAEQKELLERLVDDGYEWAKIITEFGNRGWFMSPALLRTRAKEWGLRD